MTTPKLPPPPRIAQNRSAFSSSSRAHEACRRRARRPRRRCCRSPGRTCASDVPTPPPSSSPTPVVEMTPTGVASPNACVAWSTSPIVLPPPTCAVRAARIDAHVQRIGDRSITSPPSTVPRPAPLWPPPRTAMSSPFARANASAARTSATSRQRTIERRALVDHRVVDGACLVVARVLGRDDPAFRAESELLEPFERGDRRHSHPPYRRPDDPLQVLYRTVRELQISCELRSGDRPAQVACEPAERAVLTRAARARCRAGRFGRARRRGSRRRGGRSRGGAR